MSVASEFPPEVVIPERARRTMPRGGPRLRHLSLVPSTRQPGTAPSTRQLNLVPPGVGTGRPGQWHVPGVGGRLRPGRVALASVRPVRFGESRLDWPVTVPPASRPLRLTRRGLAVAVLATLLLAGMLLLVAGLSAPSPRSAPAIPAGSTVVVQPGDTLWSIAQRAEPNSDPRLVVEQLRKANHLTSVTLSPGQTLKVG
ncbi:MAG TPA: LysM peptidoglycan-binding domain-containing protein [Jatrophihabitans sp.]|nr:LysM peptidoglycan-binding domain-containing protein [Jatrophihabitans sp.]